jgi:hypothetical protein
MAYRRRVFRAHNRIALVLLARAWHNWPYHMVEGTAYG